MPPRPRLAALATLVAFAALAPACQPAPDEGELVRSEKQRITTPSVPPADAAALAAANTDFAFDLYQVLRTQDGNLFYSPHSISIALAMTYAGARAATATQMADTLHFTLPAQRLHPAFNALDLALASRGQNAKGATGPFRLRIANALWGQSGFPFLPDFLDLLAENYGAGLRVVDFRAAPEPARTKINAWVSPQTNGRIPELLPQGSVSSDTRLVLTNAVYFNAAWRKPFDPAATRDGPFHALDGSTAAVPLMKLSIDTEYAEADGWQAVSLPYDGNELSMVLIVPAPGRFAELDAKLDGARARSILAALRSNYEVALTLPRWKTESSAALADTLAAMGMPDAFSPAAADLSGIDGARDLYISDVVHKAWVQVNEAGTEAAAATGVVVGVTSIPQPATVTVDRPFVYLVRDNATGAILFIGRVVKL